MKAKIVSFQMNCQIGDVRANLEKIRSLANTVNKIHPDFVFSGARDHGICA
jgi:predicted amidohydrolase